MPHTTPSSARVGAADARLSPRNHGSFRTETGLELIPRQPSHATSAGSSWQRIPVSTPGLVRSRWRAACPEANDPSRRPCHGKQASGRNGAGLLVVVQLESASAGGGVASFSREAGASPRGNQRSPRYCNWMSNENVQAVREVIDAFNRRDFDAAMAPLRDDIAWERFSPELRPQARRCEARPSSWPSGGVRPRPSTSGSSQRSSSQ